jgi:hypothetical protein
VGEGEYIELKPAKARKRAAELVVGRTLPDELFDMDQIWGRRILVVAESPETTYGHIIIPKSVQAREPKTTGWVVAAGPLVGTPAPGQSGWSPFYAEDLILKRVLFRAHVGTELPVVEDPGKKTDKEFSEWIEAGETSAEVLARPYIIMNDLDVLWSY